MNRLLALSILALAACGTPEITLQTINPAAAASSKPLAPIQLQPENGWTSPDAELSPMAWKDSVGTVWLSGVVNSPQPGSGPNAGIALTLPAGYRPALDRHFIVADLTSGMSAIFTVSSEGRLILEAGTPGDTVALDQIYFPAS